MTEPGSGVWGYVFVPRKCCLRKVVKDWAVPRVFSAHVVPIDQCGPLPLAMDRLSKLRETRPALCWETLSELDLYRNPSQNWDRIGKLSKSWDRSGELLTERERAGIKYYVLLIRLDFHFLRSIVRSSVC